VLIRGGVVAPPYAATARMQTLGVAQPSAAAARLDPRCGPPTMATARLRCGAVSPPSTPTTGMGRLNAATQIVVTTRHWGNLNVGHLDVEASVGADEGNGRS
jgi:hypothetical protein